MRWAGHWEIGRCIGQGIGGATAIGRIGRVGERGRGGDWPGRLGIGQAVWDWTWRAAGRATGQRGGIGPSAAVSVGRAYLCDGCSTSIRIERSPCSSESRADVATSLSESSR